MFFLLRFDPDDELGGFDDLGDATQRGDDLSCLRQCQVAICCGLNDCTRLLGQRAIGGQRQRRRHLYGAQRRQHAVENDPDGLRIACECLRAQRVDDLVEVCRQRGAPLGDGAAPRRSAR